MPICDESIEFDVCVPPDKVLPKMRILARLSDDVTLSIGKMVVISAGKHVSRMGTYDPNDFPYTKRDFDFSVGHTIPSDEFVDALKKTVAVADQDSPFPALEGVYFSNGDMVSADGTKITLFNNIPVLDEDTLVYAASLAKIAKAIDGVGDITIVRSGNKIAIAWSYGIATATIIEYDFPDYKKLIPMEYETVIRVDKNLLRATIGLAASEAQEINGLLIFDIQDSVLLVQATADTGMHTSEIDCLSASGPPKRFGVAYQYVKDALSKMETGIVGIGINSTNGLIVFYSDEDYRYGIMPMAIRE